MGWLNNELHTHFFSHSSANSAAGKSTKFLRWGTYYAAFKAWHVASEDQDKPTFSYPKFLEICKDNHYLRTLFDKYLCPYCLEKLDADNPSSRYQYHRKQVTQLSEAYKQCKEHLGWGEALFVADYSRFHESESFKVHSYNIAWIQRDVRTHQYTTVYLDFVANYPHTWRFTRAAWETLFLHSPFSAILSQLKKVYIWQDGGLKTMQNLGTINTIINEVHQQYPNSELKASMHFFAPHHGHSICDSHFSNVKKHLRNKLSGNLLMNSKIIVDTMADLPHSTAFELSRTEIENVNADLTQLQVFVKRLPQDPWTKKTLKITGSAQVHQQAQARQSKHHFEKPVLIVLREAGIVTSEQKKFTVQDMRDWLISEQMPSEGLRPELIERIRNMVLF
ncbi:hypothetical protein Pelo_18652 [Pelomyxa schiedti]|nr:hypothetical protein Pelo_18652 [Pelomyxa schiedti]